MLKAQMFCDTQTEDQLIHIKGTTGYYWRFRKIAKSDY